MKKLLLTTIAALVYANVYATANINVSPLDVTFSHSGQHYGDIFVRNTTKQTAYVSVNLTKVENPGLKNQKIVKEEMKHGIGNFGLIATPDKVIIPPRQIREIRFMPLYFGNKTDELYYASVLPEKGKLLYSKHNLKSNHEIAIGLQVILGYKVKVTIRPKNPEAIITAKRHGKTVSFENVGNSFAVIDSINQCNKNGKRCKNLVPGRVYPNQIWKFKVPYDAPISYVEDFMGKTKTGRVS